ncbi:MAG: hypothetical protein GQ470_01515 [Gammaproteobacteria bacterium]|nr:hypothetical protein [Gammaproteobacteria bacterium]
MNKQLNLLSVGRFLLVPWLLLSTDQAIAEHAGPGAAFSDPSHTETLPESWIQQPIKYQDVPANSDLVVTLDQHLYPALLPLIKDFARQRQLRIAVQEGTCGISAGALLDKKVDIGGFCCPAGDTDRLPGLQFHTLGIAALALITHPNNPIDNLTLEMARLAFGGGIADWRQTTADDTETLPEIGPVQPVARLHCKNRPGHWRLILADEDHFSPVTQEVSTIPDMIQRVAGQPGTIGFETLWMTRLHSEHPVKALHVDGNSPEDIQPLLDGRYPFYRSYNITTWESEKTRKPLANELVRYFQSHFESIDPKYGFVSSDKLRKAGWHFKGDELVAAPY